MTDPTDLPVESPDEEPSVDPDAPTTGGARGAVVVGARVLSGVIGTGVAVVVLAAATLIPFPEHSVSVPSVLVTPVATSQQRVCAGPLLQLGDSSGKQATTPSSFGRPTVRTVASSGSVQVSSLPSTDNAGGVAPSVLTIAPGTSGQNGTLFAGSQSQVAASGDDVGFAASECASGSGDSWLVGGATSTGRTTLISLSNPTEVAATASLSIFTESGSVASAGLEGIDVPAGGQRVISLAAFAPDAQSPVVRVQSRGGSIVSTMQQTTVRTLDPGGIDIIDPTTTPSTTTVIPGVVISNSSSVFAALGQAGYSDLASVVRLLAPGSADAKVTLTVKPAKPGPDGTAPDGASAAGSASDTDGPSDTTNDGSSTVSVTAGSVLDVPLGAYPNGTYTITVASDQPVVAGARISTVGQGGGNDFAWFSGAQKLPGTTVFVVAPGPLPQLSIANPGTLPSNVVLTPAQGDAVTVAVPAHGSIAVPVVSGESYTLTSSVAVSLAVSYLGDGQLAAFAVSPPAAASQPIRIYK